jgi:hypothetical protein
MIFLRSTRKSSKKNKKRKQKLRRVKPATIMLYIPLIHEGDTETLQLPF